MVRVIRPGASVAASCSRERACNLQKMRPKIRLLHSFITPMRRVSRYGFIAVADRIFRRHRDRHFGFAGHCEISVELFDAQMPQVLAPEEVLLGE